MRKIVLKWELLEIRCSGKISLRIHLIEVTSWQLLKEKAREIAQSRAQRFVTYLTC